MGAGILRSMYIKRVRKSTTIVEYMLNLHALALYEFNVFNYNRKFYIIDK